jgi:hypothetical protein
MEVLSGVQSFAESVFLVTKTKENPRVPRLTERDCAAIGRQWKDLQHHCVHLAQQGEYLRAVIGHQSDRNDKRSALNFKGQKQKHLRPVSLRALFQSDPTDHRLWVLIHALSHTYHALHALRHVPLVIQKEPVHLLAKKSIFQTVLPLVLQRQKRFPSPLDLQNQQRD